MLQYYDSETILGFIISSTLNTGTLALPGHQYVLTTPIDQAVHRAIYEPVCFSYWFLMCPCFGFRNYQTLKGIAYSYESIAISKLSMDEWEHFLVFLKKNVKKYPCIPKKSEYIKLITRQVVDIMKTILSNDTSSLTKKVPPVKNTENKQMLKKAEYLILTFFVDLNIPLLRNYEMTTILYSEIAKFFPQLFIRLLKRNVIDNSELSQHLKTKLLFEILLKKLEIFTTSLKNCQVDVIDLILDFYERYAMNHNDIMNYLADFYPIHIMISEAFVTLAHFDMNKNFHTILTLYCRYISTIRKTFLKITNNELDVFKISSTKHALGNVMFTLISAVCHHLHISKQPEKVWKIFKNIYQTLTIEQGFIDLIDRVKNSNGDHILMEAIQRFEVFEYLLSKDQPKEILEFYQNLLYTTRYDVFRERHFSLFNLLLSNALSTARVATKISSLSSADVLLNIRKLKSYYQNEKLFRQVFKQSKPWLTITKVLHPYSHESKKTCDMLLKLFSEWGTCEE